MGIWYEILVANVMPVTEVDAAADRVIQWLIDAEIIDSELSSESVLGRQGYRPGHQFNKAIRHPEEITTGWMYEGDEYLQLYEFRHNGVRVEKGRQGFLGSHGGYIDICCENCGTLHDLALYSGDIPGALEAFEWWCKGDEVVLFPCPQCGLIRSVAEWDFNGTYALGNLGFTFYNWPQLKDSFALEIGQLLGSKITQVYGKH